LNVLSTGGAFLLGAALLIALVNLVIGLKWGDRAARNPWRSRAFEWLTDSPPSKHNFHQTPRLGDLNPYDYTVSEEEWRERAG
jgi:cytochrome c oxidase subunit 1